MRFRSLALLLFMLIPAMSFATWQIAGEPLRTSGNQPNKMVPGIPTYYQTNSHYTLVTQPGYLITNVRNYAMSHGWRMRWMAKRDYRINVVAKISGPSFSVVLNRLLANYPLHASYNQSHKTVTIKRG